MYNILTVIENRVLLKKIDSYLDDLQNSTVRIILYSVNAFSWFIEIHPEIIILDSNLVTNYKLILRQFAQSQWDYRVLLLVDNDAQKVIHPNVLHIDKKIFQETPSIWYTVKQSRR